MAIVNIPAILSSDHSPIYELLDRASDVATTLVGRMLRIMQAAQVELGDGVSLIYNFTDQPIPCHVRPTETNGGHLLWRVEAYTILLLQDGTLEGQLSGLKPFAHDCAFCERAIPILEAAAGKRKITMYDLAEKNPQGITFEADNIAQEGQEWQSA